MGSKKNLIKGLAAGVVLGAIASLIMATRHAKEAKQFGAAAEKIKDKAIKHAKKIGRLTKSAYDKIVETTIAEYRGAKALSDVELDELRDELKKQWTHLAKLIKK